MSYNSNPLDAFDIATTDLIFCFSSSFAFLRVSIDLKGDVGKTMLK